MRITATRRLQFAIGHRVMLHESKCRHLHGHNFVFFLTAESTEGITTGIPKQDVQGRIIDFGVLKAKLGTWIEDHWDHGFVLCVKDEAGLAAMKTFEREEGPGEHWKFIQKLYVLDENPTAENLAKHLLLVIGPQVLKDTGVVLTKVVVHETENGIAEATL